MLRRLALVIVPLISTLLCFSQQPAKDSEAYISGLRGPVHAVQEEFWVYQKVKMLFLTSYTVYDEKGYLLELNHYNGEGTLRTHTKVTRQGSITRQETNNTGLRGDRTLLEQHDGNGVVTGTETYDRNGTLIEKTETELPRTKSGGIISTERRSNPEGTVSVSTTVESKESAGTIRRTTTRDGKLERDWLLQQDAEGRTVSEAMRFPDGSFSKREYGPDGTMTENVYLAPPNTHLHRIIDKNNHMLESIEDSPDNYTRTTYKYDDAGNQTEFAMFGRSGKLLVKKNTKRQFDAFGNWTEEKTFGWSPEMGSQKPKLFSVRKRIVSYY
jgi:hypothetical protein